ncbi:MAG TPA: hypothetical protein VGO31_11855 [Microbacteriaceae bacterium]|nr:hypothetical protein [Microbacteriaceae bacterium]
MTDAEPKRSEDETSADAVRRRLVETVQAQLEEIERTTSSDGADDETASPA